MIQVLDLELSSAEIEKKVKAKMKIHKIHNGRTQKQRYWAEENWILECSTKWVI